MCVDSYTIPLLADHHSHPFLYAGLMDGVDLASASTREEVIRLVRAASERSRGGWTVAQGWNSRRHSLLARDFDDLPPLAILDVSLHGFLLNRAARDLMTATAPEVIAHLDDQPWLERHMLRILTCFVSRRASSDRLRGFFGHLLEDHGVYFVEEMLISGEDEIRLFEEASLSDRTRFWASPDVYERISEGARSKVHGIKLFADGAIGTWTAAFHNPYRDTGGYGLLMYDFSEFADVAAHYLDRDLRLAIHAIGDRAIDHVVEVLERVAPTPGRVRIEHAQLISLQSAERAKALGLHLCMQPNFSVDSVLYESRLPEGCANLNNPFRMLIDEVGFVPGEDLLFGSDGMPHGVDEALRQSLFPPLPSQVLTIEEFVAGYCVDGTSPGQITVEVDRENQRIRSRVELHSVKSPTEHLSEKSRDRT